MCDSKVSSLLLVGSSKDKDYFQKYFKTIEFVDSNYKAFEIYKQKRFSVTFLDCDLDKDSAFDVSKKIKEIYNQAIIAIIAKNIDNERLKRAIPLHLSGYMDKPFRHSQIEETLSNIRNDFKQLSIGKIILKDGYYFDTIYNTLYDSNRNEIKLTKNEDKLLNMFIETKDKYVSKECIEYEVWEDESIETDCTSRLKGLIYKIRKKLPRGSISNTKNLGYRLVYSTVPSSPDLEYC